MGTWTPEQPEENGYYWYLEPGGEVPTIVVVKRPYLGFPEKDWDYQPAEPGTGELFFSEPIAQPSTPETYIDIGGHYTANWPEVEGIYWTFRSPLGVQLAQFNSDGRGYLGTDDYSDRHEPLHEELFWSERLIPPAVPEAIPSLLQ